MQKVVIHTDGACHGNPGPGGWAAILTSGGKNLEISGAVLATTNNRMELQSAIEALTALKRPCDIELHTDSNYLRSGVTEWVHGWKKNGWKTKAKQPVKNADLWRQLDALTTTHRIDWRWVKGHAGHAENERCDFLATEAIVQLKAAQPASAFRAALESFNASMAEPQAASLL